VPLFHHLHKLSNTSKASGDLEKSGIGEMMRPFDIRPGLGRSAFTFLQVRFAFQNKNISPLQLTGN